MTQYGPMFGFIFIAWVLILTIRIGTYLDKNIAKNQNMPEPQKACPPHSWAEEEQIGIKGVFRLRCQRCRRLPGWETKD